MMKWKEIVYRDEYLLKIEFRVFVDGFLDLKVFEIEELKYFVLVIDYKLELKDI